MTVFVSHAWANKWGLVVAMLAAAFDAKRCEDLKVFFWIDVFAICQTSHAIVDGALRCTDAPALQLANQDDVRCVNEDFILTYQRQSRSQNNIERPKLRRVSRILSLNKQLAMVD